MPGTSAGEAAPERVRWPRLTATPDPRLGPLLSRGYVGYTEATMEVLLSPPGRLPHPLRSRRRLGRFLT
jgi:hypothetical protein